MENNNGKGNDGVREPSASAQERLRIKWQVQQQRNAAHNDYIQQHNDYVVQHNDYIVQHNDYKDKHERHNEDLDNFEDEVDDTYG